MLELVVNSSITHSLLVVLPVLCAFLLRRARCPGAAVVGGALAGILLGPAILGRIAPVTFEKHFVGATELREARDATLRRHLADLIAADAARLGPEAREELFARNVAEAADANRALDEARWRFQRPFRSYLAAIIVLTMLSAGALRVPASDRRAGLAAPASIGLWSAAVPGAVAYTVLDRFAGAAPASAALAAAAVAIGPCLIPDVDRETADRAELGGAHLVQSAGRIAAIIAIGAGAGAMLIGFEGRLGWWAPMLALPLGWLLPALPPSGASASGLIPLDTRALVRATYECALLPTLTACAALRIELFEHFAPWTIIVFAILSGDGRWLGAVLGAMLPGGRRALRTMRLVLGTMAAGPTQLAVAAIAVQTGAVSEEVAFALLVGAVLVEVTTPARRNLARRLAEMEVEIEAGEDGRP